LVVEREHPDRVENLKAAGATRINSRVNGEQRPNGLIDFMQFYDLLPTPVVVDNPHPNSKVNENGRRYNNKAESSHSMGLADRAMHDLLPTPNASDCHNQNTAGDHDLEKGYLRGVAVDMWKKGLLLPTPLVVEREHPERVENLKAAGATRINSRVNGEQRPNGLIDFMQFYELLPTPIAGDCHNPNPPDGKANTRRREQGWTIQLNERARMGILPTPFLGTVTATSGCRTEKFGKGRNISPKELARKIAESTELDNAGKTSRLSPLFTEEMMGFPLMWTALPFLSESGAPKPSKPTATPSSPK
jgi:hypothetical protein